MKNEHSIMLDRELELLKIKTYIYKEVCADAEEEAVAYHIMNGIPYREAGDNMGGTRGKVEYIAEKIARRLTNQADMSLHKYWRGWVKHHAPKVLDKRHKK